ncbi:MAG: 30S ribosomal protein S21 [Patescibacteria group bacterium]|nr:30S ribosomal protein S21 [Patescibacteria group bacterium]MCL5093625.1 30S ribosomal protein S21 [Patescibacteria group bacterium]
MQVARKEKESFENLLRRFNRKVQQSGILIIAKNKQYKEKKISKKDQRATAIRKAAIKEGKLKELLRGF